MNGMNSKRQQITNRIQEHGEGYRVDAREIWVLAMECECSAQYVRTVRAELRAAGVLDEDVFIGRWVKPEEIAAYVKTQDAEGIGFFASAALLAEMARHFSTTVEKLQAAIDWAASSRVVEIEYGYYGNYLKAA